MKKANRLGGIMSRSVVRKHGQRGRRRKEGVIRSGWEFDSICTVRRPSNLLWNIQVWLCKRLQFDCLHVVCSCITFTANVQRCLLCLILSVGGDTLFFKQHKYMMWNSGWPRICCPIFWKAEWWKIDGDTQIKAVGEECLCAYSASRWQCICLALSLNLPHWFNRIGIYLLHFPEQLSTMFMKKQWTCCL